MGYKDAVASGLGITVFDTAGKSARIAGRPAPAGWQCAIYAGLAGALIHAVADLEKSLAPLGIHVIGDRGAAGGNGFGEHLAESLVQTHDAILAQSGGNRQWGGIPARKSASSA